METTSTLDDTEHGHRRSLNGILSFLDEYHPASPDKRNAIHSIRDRLRSGDGTTEDLAQLARHLVHTEFQLRRGNVKTLPGLARRASDCARAAHNACGAALR